jgi:DNA-3-methyladenine glycosylase I
LPEKDKIRCQWALGNPFLLEYHDNEWGVPVHEDNLLFEFLILEGAQAGLSWLTILKKRDNYRKAFDDFNPVKVSKYSDEKISQILQNALIVRNRLKVSATVENAKNFLAVQKEFGSFDDYIWRFSKKRDADRRQMPSTTPESDSMSADLKRRGFKFVGSTICYSFMQATGLVNDHEIICFRFKEIGKLK